MSINLRKGCFRLWILLSVIWIIIGSWLSVMAWGHYSKARKDRIDYTAYIDSSKGHDDALKVPPTWILETENDSGRTVRRTINNVQFDEVQKAEEQEKAARIWFQFAATSTFLLPIVGLLFGRSLFWVGAGFRRTN